MKELLDAFKIFDSIQQEFREVSREIYHSRPLATYSLDITTKNGDKEEVKRMGEITLDLRDSMLLGPLTQTNEIITGKSGTAKTHLAEMMLAVCYGADNYGFLPINSGLSEEKLRNFVFDVIKKGGDLSEATKSTLILSAPGVLLDELNRSPKELMGILQNYLQNGKLVFEGGCQIIPGVPLKNGKVYQFKIGTCNEGKEYAVFTMDKAYRDRFGFEIPITSFPMTEDDRRKLDEKLSTGMHFAKERCKANRLEGLLAIDSLIQQIESDILAREMIRYLSRMSNCVKSQTKSKDDIEMTQELCQGCHAVAADNRICPEVRAPTERIVITLQHMAKAFAFMRGYKMVKAVAGGDINAEYMKAFLNGSGLKGEKLADKFLEQYLTGLTAAKEDVTTAAPFVLMNKVDINPVWVKKHFQGNQYLAINFLIQSIDTKLQNFFKANSDILFKHSNAAGEASPLTEEDWARLKKYSLKDPWCTDLKQLESCLKESGEKKEAGPKLDLLK